MQIEEAVAMKTVKTVFSVGRETKQSTRLGHGHWSHCTRRGIWKPSYTTYRAYLAIQGCTVCVLTPNQSDYGQREQSNPTSYMNPPSNIILNTRLQRYVHQRAPAIGSLLFFRVSSSSSCPLLLSTLARPELWRTVMAAHGKINTQYLLRLTQTWRDECEKCSNIKSYKTWTHIDTFESVYYSTKTSSYFFGLVRCELDGSLHNQIWLWLPLYCT